jgi:RNA polymerase sigma-70 factor (ECF subfamily)
MAIQSLRTDDCAAEVLQKYSDMVYRLAFAQTKNKHDAEDVYQEVFVRYISKPRIFENEEHRKAWFIRVTIQRSRSFWAKLSRFKTVPLEESGDIAAETRIEDDISEYLSLLPEKYRPVIYLFYCEDLSTKQIAEILGANDATIRTWLKRARNILKQKLKGECTT